MILVLVRHGNTFASGDKVVWIGKGEDLPLVERGEQQAMEVAEALLPLKPSISSLSTGPLKRARTTGDILKDKLALSDKEIIEDYRLDEIDYGKWGGKSTEELVAEGFEEEIHAWNSRGVYPTSAEWGVSEEDLFERAKSFLRDLEETVANSVHIAVTSNGILRYFLRQVPDAYDSYAKKGLLKVRTGALSVLKYEDTDESSRWRVLCWNVLPKDFNGIITGENVNY